MNTEDKVLTIGATLFEEFELLDLYGPLEMFTCLKERVEIVTMAERSGPVASSKVSGYADCSFEDSPKLDILLIPGGWGTRKLLSDEKFVDWLRKKANSAQVVASVCTGSLLLGASGLLDGRRATSNKLAWDWTSKVSDKVAWIPQARWVVDGKFYTSAGVSAGMDMSLALIEDIWGANVREEVRIKTEYDWHADPNWDPFATLAGIA
ncbi:DJ-1/PfpI family protein [Puniceicoccaceae bacterium K14]|nr:DJ-1/PfpI family protein [Puniceicoccaceae bacterium K14]